MQKNLFWKIDAVNLMKQFAWQVQIGKFVIPRILLGTSPFVGAGQFGPRATLYYSKFYLNPQNIMDIVRRAADLGVLGIQVLPLPPILQAIKEVEKELGEEFIVVGSVGLEDPLTEIRQLQNFNTAAMLLHARVTDLKDESNISVLLEEIRNVGSLAGLTTHKPLSTLSWLDGRELNYDLLMFPFNRLGAFMDGSPKEIAIAAKKLRKPLLAKKVLAAGRLKPAEALEYVSALGFIDGVVLGVASESEAEETFKAAFRTFSKHRREY